MYNGDVSPCHLVVPTSNVRRWNRHGRGAKHAGGGGGGTTKTFFVILSFGNDRRREDPEDDEMSPRPGSIVAPTLFPAPKAARRPFRKEAMTSGRCCVSR